MIIVPLLRVTWLSTHPLSYSVLSIKALMAEVEKDKNVMIRDIEQADYYGDECDKACWKALLSKLKE